MPICTFFFEKISNKKKLVKNFKFLNNLLYFPISTKFKKNAKKFSLN